MDSDFQWFNKIFTTDSNFFIPESKSFVYLQQDFNPLILYKYIDNERIILNTTPPEGLKTTSPDVVRLPVCIQSYLP